MDKGNNWFIIFVHQLPEAEMDTCQSVGSLMGKHSRSQPTKKTRREIKGLPFNLSPIKLATRWRKAFFLWGIEMLSELILVNRQKPFSWLCLLRSLFWWGDSASSLNFYCCLFLLRSLLNWSHFWCYHYPCPHSAQVKHTRANKPRFTNKEWQLSHFQLHSRNVLSPVIFSGTEYSFMSLIRIPFRKRFLDPVSLPQ